MARRGSIKVKVNRRALQDVDRKIDKATQEAMEVITTDLLRVSSEAAPFEEGDLERSGEKAIFNEGDTVIGVVGFEVYNEDFEYAEWIHEDMSYELQELSLAKPDAKGLSGKSYPVDRKYMTRPLYGESNHYKKILDRHVEKALS